MRYIKQIFCPWYLFLLALFLLHQFCERVLRMRHPLTDNYLDSLLCMPLICHLLLWERRILFKKPVTYILSDLDLFVIFVVVSFLAEYLFPLMHPGFTADIVDVYLYLAGTFIFRWYFNKPIHTT